MILDPLHLPKVSIVVPTYHQWDLMKSCLDALYNQVYPSTLVQIVIVNNDPADLKPDTLNLNDRTLMLHESKPGSYAARNAALQVCTGEIIGFTDSDCIPDRNWILNAVAHFQTHKSCFRIAGHIDVVPVGLKATIAERYDQLYAFRQEQYASLWGTCVTGNLFSYRRVFDEVGGFDERKMSFGDMDWGIKANKAGFTINYVPKVIVRHPARSVRQLIKKERRLAGGREKFNNIGESRVEIYTKFLKEIRPKFRGEIKYISSNGKHLDRIEQFLVLSLRCRLNFVRAVENMRLRLGKKPNRE